MKQLLITSIASLALLGAAHAAGDATAGKTKSAMCVACHGTDGNSAAPNFPKLAGQHGDYTVKQLKEFKSGERQDATMAGMVAALSGVYFGTWLEHKARTETEELEDLLQHH